MKKTKTKKTAKNKQASKAKKPAKAKSKKPARVVKTGAKASAKPEENETMERNDLKVIVSQLKEMGSDIKVLKSDTDEGLQKKVNEALQRLPPPDILKKLETVEPSKLVSVLKRDCIGVFIDLSDVSCVNCTTVTDCARLFIQNLKGSMKDLAPAMVDPKSKDKKKDVKAKHTPVTRYEKKRLVFVRDVKNPNTKGDDLFDTIRAILKEEPGTLGELREIAERDFDFANDADFMKLVTSLRDPEDPKEAIIKLDVDLSESDKSQLREAGVEI